MTGPKDVIDDIRRNEYLIDVDLPAQAVQGAKNIRETLNRALKILAEDLYSSETHFVLELIQNADDNEYVPDTQPEITLTVNPRELRLTNNETGFTAVNVRALCSIGNSTKARREGFIGEKGIGFKSVFTVSAQPEIHSNGFHFRFDISGANPLGYVVPEWLPGRPDSPGTQILLPAKAGHTFTAEFIGQLFPELLLFLRKLRRFSVEQGADSQIVERHDEGSRVLLRVTHTSLIDTDQTDTRTYLRVSHRFDVRDIQEEKRPDVTESEIVLAFPLTPEGSADSIESHAVFAFLPIRDFGFKFVLHADFLLSSSREDLHRESPWNLRIRNQIAAAFASALPYLKDNAALAASFLEYVPAQNGITDPFFRAAAKQIETRLATEPCVPAASGAWRRPSEILTVGAGFQSLFPNDDIWTALAFEYAAPEITPAAKLVLARLGATSITLPQLVTLLESDAITGARPTQWFARLYAYLDKLTDEKWIIRLRSVPFVLTLKDELKSPAECEIFFPLRRETSYGFEDELEILDPELLVGEHADVEHVYNFLKRIGVKEASPPSLIEHHILPRHTGDAWSKSKVTALIGHARYIKDHLQAYKDRCTQTGDSAADAIKRLSVLRIHTKETTNGGGWFSLPAQLYLSTEYAPAVELERLLGDAADPSVFVDPVYLKGQGQGAVRAAATRIAEWRAFFHEIGVHSLPTIYYFSNYDYEAGPELKKLLGSSNATTLQEAITLIERNWSHYRSFIAMRPPCGNLRSTFLQTLRDLSVPTTKKKPFSLCQTYLGSDMIRAVFGASPPYIDIPLTDAAFMDAVGITQQVDADACFKRLDQIRTSGRVPGRDLKHIYHALDGRFTYEPSTVKQGLVSEPRIYVPTLKTWHSTGEVVWFSGGRLLDSLHPPLEKAYRDEYAFFCKRLGVPNRPDEDALVAALMALPNYEAPRDEKHQEAFSIFRQLAGAFRDGIELDPHFSPHWLDRLRRERLFYDHVGRAVEASNDLYIDDDVRLAELFKDQTQVSLFPADRDRIAVVRPLLEACNIPTLSESVQYRLESVSDRAADSALTRRIRSRTDALMRLLFHRHHAVFTRAQRNNVWKTLRRLTVVRVGSLVVEAHLAKATAQYTGDVFLDDTTLYIHRDARSSRDKISQELSAFIGAKPEVADAVFRILFEEHDQDVEEFLEVKGIPPIPAEELERLRPQIREPEPYEPDTLDVISDVASSEKIDAPSADELTASFNTLADIDVSAGIETGREVNEIRHDTEGNTDSNADIETQAGADNESVADIEGEGGVASSTVGGGGFRVGHTSRRLEHRHQPATGRLLSYAEPRSEDDMGPPRDPRDAEQNAERQEIAAAAVAFVLAQERAQGHTVQEMAPNNEGFDLLRTNDDATQYYIEVKGQSGPWTDAGIILTPVELRYAERFRAHYFIYVVEFAKDPVRRVLYRIQDPFGKVLQFRFDRGWKDVAITHDITEPAVGLQVQLPEGYADIVSVRRSGSFFSLEVRLPTGAAKRLTYIPGQMALRRPDDGPNAT